MHWGRHVFVSLMGKWSRRLIDNLPCEKRGDTGLKVGEWVRRKGKYRQEQAVHDVGWADSEMYFNSLDWRVCVRIVLMGSEIVPCHKRIVHTS